MAKPSFSHNWSHLGESQILENAWITTWFEDFTLFYWSHQVKVTRLPVHWWASSWATMLTTAHLVMVMAYKLMVMSRMLTITYLSSTSPVNSSRRSASLLCVRKSLLPQSMEAGACLLYMERPQFSMAVILPGTDTMSCTHLIFVWYCKNFNLQDWNVSPSYPRDIKCVSLRGYHFGKNILDSKCVAKELKYPGIN